MEITVGIKVMARGLPWEVLAVQPLGAQQRVRLACLGGDLQGLEWDLLHPVDALAPLNDDPGPADAGTPDEWRRYHTAWLLDQVPGAPAPPGRLTIEPYQRVPLLRALDMARPRLLMLDEPSLGLAPLIVAQIFETISTLRSRGVSVLLVEQNALMALDCADAGYVLETGQIALSGPAAALRADARLAALYLGGEVG